MRIHLSSAESSTQPVQREQLTPMMAWALIPAPPARAAIRTNPFLCDSVCPLREASIVGLIERKGRKASDDQVASLPVSSYQRTYFSLALLRQFSTFVRNVS
jgi:hypothetical protein